LAVRRVPVEVRAGAFLVARAVAVLRVGDFAAFVAAVLRAGVLFAAVLAVVALRVVAFFAAVLAAPVLRAGVFFAVVFAGDFLAAVVALVAVFLAGDFFAVVFFAAPLVVVAVRVVAFFAAVLVAVVFLAVAVFAGDFLAVVFLPVAAFVVFFAVDLAAPTGRVTAFLAPDLTVRADLFAVVVAGTFASLGGISSGGTPEFFLVVRMTLFDILSCDLCKFGASRKPFPSRHFVPVTRHDRAAEALSSSPYCANPFVTRDLRHFCGLVRWRVACRTCETTSAKNSG
jgi:hypothetical protein